jgi:hypothetical protein
LFSVSFLPGKKTRTLSDQDHSSFVDPILKRTEQILLEKAYIAKKLDLSAEDFEKILRLPPKWYRDYPNDEKRLTFVYNTYRKLFRKEKLGSF